MGRVFNNIRDTAKVAGRYATLENLKRGIGIGQSAVNIINQLKNSGNPNVRKIVNKVPVDNIQTALDIGKGVHHVINTRINDNPTRNDYTAKVPRNSVIPAPRNSVIPAQQRITARRPTALSEENQALQIAMNMRHTGR